MNSGEAHDGGATPNAISGRGRGHDRNDEDMW